LPEKKPEGMDELLNSLKTGITQILKTILLRCDDSLLYDLDLSRNQKIHLLRAPVSLDLSIHLQTSSMPQRKE